MLCQEDLKLPFLEFLRAHPLAPHAPLEREFYERAVADNSNTGLLLFLLKSSAVPREAGLVFLNDQQLLEELVWYLPNAAVADNPILTRAVALRKLECCRH